MKIITKKIPYQYCKFTGVGDSEHTIHAGSYHVALKDAGIEVGNIISYSSIVPVESEEVDMPDSFHWGQVLECIISTQTGLKGERIAAGVGLAPIYDKDDNYIGKLAVERQGSFDDEELKEAIHDSLYELIRKTFPDYNIDERNIEYITETYRVKEMFGTVVAGIAFINHIIVEEKID